MNLPSRKQAEAFLAEAAQLNSGSWVPHCRLAALAAEAIASHDSALDPDSAYVLGLLHDIGRREGIYQMRHSIDGFNFLNQQGYPDAARVCVTHHFVLPEFNKGLGTPDCSPAEERFLSDYLATLEYTLYDELIQLSDALAMPAGFCLVETRLVDVALRYGVDAYTLPRWQAYLKIKRKFEETIGQSIYDVLPGEVTRSFPF